MSISLNQAQLNSFNNLVNAGDYPAAYNYLAGIAENTPGADPRVTNWLKFAAHINANDGSPHSAFVRAATQKAAEDMGKPITDKRFQEVSDGLAKRVFERVSTDSSIPNIDIIIDADVNAAVTDLQLNPQGWAGTLFGWLPSWMGGLDLDVNSPFYKSVWQSLDEQGVESTLQLHKLSKETRFIL